MNEIMTRNGNDSVTRNAPIVQRKRESIQPAQFLSLHKIYTSLKDGMSGPEEWFETNHSRAN